MAAFDLIMKSFTAEWAAGGYTAILPTANIYYGRAQQPAELAGFPYAECQITIERTEVVTVVEALNSRVYYDLEITVYTAQGQTGGTDAGDQVSNQGAIQRALEAILNFIPHNNSWQYLPNFLHCIKDASSLGEDNELYLGKDVLISRQNWTILNAE